MSLIFFVLVGQNAHTILFKVWWSSSRGIAPTSKKFALNLKRAGDAPFETTYDVMKNLDNLPRLKGLFADKKLFQKIYTISNLSVNSPSPAAKDIPADLQPGDLLLVYYNSAEAFIINEL